MSSAPGSNNNDTTNTASGDTLNNNSGGGGLGIIPKKTLSEAEALAELQVLQAASDAWKKNPKMEFSSNDLLRLLSYFEGELQAYGIAFATLKNEKSKHILNLASYERQLKLNDPCAALFRDTLAMSGKMVTHHTSVMAAQAEYEVRCTDKQYLDSMCGQVVQQRMTHLKILNMMRVLMEKYKRTVCELDEERRRNENGAGAALLQAGEGNAWLECERTRLKKELDEMRVAKEKLEATLKAQQDAIDVERNNHKQMILFLVAERQRIACKYIEEHKRSEDLAQILSEEKQRVDSIAEGLEEESKKSLRMEAELEKQTQMHEHERKMMLLNLAIEEKKVKEMEADLNRLRMENEALKKSQPLSPRLMQQLQNDSNLSANPMVSSVAKVVQPTATVSSVPVSGPTTGIARSISPGQCLRQQPSLSTVANSDTIKAAGSKVRIVPISMQAQTPGTENGSQSVGGTSVAAQCNKQQSQQNPPQPPIKKSTLQSNLARGVPPPIPPNKPIINKPNTAQAPARVFMQQTSATTIVGGGAAQPTVAAVTITQPIGAGTPPANSTQKDSSGQLMDYEN